MPKLTKPEEGEIKKEGDLKEEIAPISVGDALEKVDTVFSGHPAAGKSEEELSDDDKKKAEEDLKKKAEEKPGKEKEPGTKSAEKKVKFKYASHEESETANIEAARKITEVSEKAKKERERSEALQKQVNDLLIAAKKEPEKKVKTGPTSTDKMTEMLDRISKLDPDDKNYQPKVAAIWAEREDELKAEYSANLKTAMKELKEELKKERSQESDEKTEQNKIVAAAEKTASKAGLDMKKGSKELDLFWTFADVAPEDGTIEEQVQYAIDKVNEVKKAFGTPDPEAERKAKEEREKNAILGRSGPGKPEPKKGEPVKPLGLGAAFKQTERRL